MENRKKYIQEKLLPNLSVWEKIENKRIPLTFTIELTARCNNNCRHCYINLPADDEKAKSEELTINEIDRIAKEAVSLGSLWCLITGGEPLLRNDFADIYMLLKKMGLMVSIFTNACLLRKEHIKLFKEYPPRDLEVTVYGTNIETYERVTRQKGSFKAFKKGLDLLIKENIKVRLKSMALRSNLNEFDKICSFCRKISKEYRYDFFLQRRHDNNIMKDIDILNERLSPKEIVKIESQDLNRFEAVSKVCNKFKVENMKKSNRLFSCGAGLNTFVLGYDGNIRPCSMLFKPEFFCNLREISLFEVWHNHFPEFIKMVSYNQEYINNCSNCNIKELGTCCPATMYLENGYLDHPSKYFCDVANARAGMVKNVMK